MTTLILLACTLAALAISRPIIAALRVASDRADTLKTARQSRLIRERAVMVRALRAGGAA